MAHALLRCSSTSTPHTRHTSAPHRIISLVQEILMKKVRLISAMISLLFTLLLVATTAHAKAVKVKRVTFPVTLSDEQTYSMVGYLYYHGSYKHRPLQVLLHGSTYNHEYWDVPRINGHKYSYARHMAEDGYAVLSLDQLGSGESDKPDGDFLTVQEAASGLHQVMSSLRAHDAPLWHSFHKIFLVGHSLGSVTAIYSEGTYGDADGLVITGQAVTPHPLPFDQATIDELLKQPYPTLPPDARAAFFYYAPTADPDVIDYDNLFVRDTLPRGLILSALPLLFDPTQIRAHLIPEPVLVQLGDNDLTAPASLAPSEAAYYASAESVTVATLSDIGHDFNLHRRGLGADRRVDRGSAL
jgi:pimeloyl-ACP methyl ester carboxylesterase